MFPRKNTCTLSAQYSHLHVCLSIHLHVHYAHSDEYSRKQKQCDKTDRHVEDISCLDTHSSWWIPVHVCAHANESETFARVLPNIQTSKILITDHDGPHISYIRLWNLIPCVFWKKKHPALWHVSDRAQGRTFAKAAWSHMKMIFSNLVSSTLLGMGLGKKHTLFYCAGP